MINLDIYFIFPFSVNELKEIESKQHQALRSNVRILEEMFTSFARV